ncbi:MAG TPA: HD domain-containing protein [Candidatus Omnitrophota bacterium]|nr:HD domain-containing protein [Candidatus Omnitrophota bacterium]
MILLNLPHLKIVRDLARRKKTDVHLVGGFLRDHLLGKKSTDLDFAVSDNAVAFARAFARKVKGAFVLLDKEHGCARVVRKEGEAIWTFDFSDLRAPTIKADLRSRDFTVNTLCVNVTKLKDTDDLQENILDYWGAARDLKTKTARMVSADAFKDDPLRLLRAYALKAVFGLKIEPKTVRRIKKDAGLVLNAAMERVREEVFKVLSSPRAYETTVLLDKDGLLARVLPQLSIMQGVHQGGYHHLDVWRHSLEVLRQFELLCAQEKDPQVQAYLGEEIAGNHSRAALLKLAALLHDVGKPDTRKPEGERITFHCHEHVGERITRLAAKRLKLSVKERHFLEDAVRMHLRPGYLSNFQRPTEKAMFRYLRDTGKEGAAIALLAMADQRATRGPLTTRAKAEHHEKICRMVLARFFEEKTKAPLKRLLTGRDLIKILKLKPGPIFAKILTAVEESQSLGKIATKAEALALAQKVASTFLKKGSTYL